MKRRNIIMRSIKAPDTEERLLVDMNRRIASLEEAIQAGLWSKEAMAKERGDRMAFLYGECCTKTKAAGILGRSTKTILTMVEDGRLAAAGDGMVDVRSIALYIENPKQNNFLAKQKRRGKKITV
jgi:hypothetical protein